jgi:hypothetical protein
MKIKIISDIKSDKESIIPFGLNLGKYLETGVDVLHYVDPRKSQGVYSSYADSQTISPGNKFSHTEVVMKEKEHARIALDKLISREGSVLNYPLKINTEVEEAEVEKKLKEIVKNEPNTFFVINSEMDNYMFNSQNEIIQTIENIGAISLLVSSGQQFRKFKEVMMPTDFNSNDFVKYPKLYTFFKQFNAVINATTVATEKKYLEAELKGKNWKKTVNSIFPSLKLTTTVLRGENDAETFISHIQRNKPDLILLMKRKRNIFQRLYKKDSTKKIIESTDAPVMYHS